MNHRVVPESDALALLDEVSDACAVFDKRTTELLWHNTAWSEFERSLSQLQSPSSSAHLTSAEQKLGPLAVAANGVPSRHTVAWHTAGIRAFETQVILRPYEADGRECTAVLVLGPRPAINLPKEFDTTDQLDPLTGLRGRAAIENRISHLTRCGSGTAEFALLFLDLDGFKSINDNLGHVAGDYVLAEVATRLAGAIRTGDLIVRYGGDEFLVLVHGIRELRELEPVLHRLRSAAETPIEFDKNQLNISASIGAALSHERWQSVADLVAIADERMYADKQHANSTAE